MKYKGKELVKFKSESNVAFNPPKVMLVWDDDNGGLYCKTKVFAYTPALGCPVITWTGAHFRFCAEVPKGKTNWDVYQERYGATMKSLKEAIESFNASHIPCEFCPERGHCASDVRSGECTETFAEWAETEAKDETAGNV